MNMPNPYMMPPQEEKGFIENLWDIVTKPWNWLKAALGIGVIGLAADKFEPVRNVLNKAGEPFDIALGEKAADIGKNFNVLGSPEKISDVGSFVKISKNGEGHPTFEVDPNKFFVNKKKVSELLDVGSSFNDYKTAKFSLIEEKAASNNLFRAQGELFDVGFRLFAYNAAAEKFNQENAALIDQGKAKEAFTVDLSKIPTKIPQNLESYFNKSVSNYGDMEPIEKLKYIHKTLHEDIKREPDFEDYAFKTSNLYDAITYNLPEFMFGSSIASKIAPVGIKSMAINYLDSLTDTVERKERGVLIGIKRAIDEERFEDAKSLALAAKDYFLKEGTEEKKNGSNFKQYTQAGKNFGKIAEYAENLGLRKDLHEALSEYNNAIIPAANSAYNGALAHEKGVKQSGSITSVTNEGGTERNAVTVIENGSSRESIEKEKQRNNQNKVVSDEASVAKGVVTKEILAEAQVAVPQSGDGKIIYDNKFKNDGTFEAVPMTVGKASDEVRSQSPNK